MNEVLEMDFTTFLEEWVEKCKKRDRVNEYISNEYVNTYVRWTTRRIGENKYKTMEIGNITIENKQQGHFTKFLTAFEDIARRNDRIVMVECVQEDFLKNFLKKRGYISEDGDTFYLL